MVAAATRGEWSRLGPSGRRDGVLVLAGEDPPTLVLGDGAPRRQGAQAAAHLAGWPSPVVVSGGLGGAAEAEWAYGLRLRAVRPLRKYQSVEKDDQPAWPERVVVETGDPTAAAAAYARREAVARGVFLARDLVAEPGNRLGPGELAERAGLLQSLGVSVDLLDPAGHGLGLLAAVGQGSARPPMLAVLRWNGGPADQRPLVLAGKGITFDSGGLSIKPAEHMDRMKGDMGGAAAVLGTLCAVATRRAAVNVAGVLAIAENMPGAGALRPGDVVRSYRGLTVEVVDTDAEGRLVLADALAWAADHLRPRTLVDVATLTGAVVRVLGHHHGGLYCNRDSLSRRLLTLGRSEDEPLWRLPLSAACDEHLRSDIADWRNCGWGAVPDNDDAARFLQHFLPPALPWAHLDICLLYTSRRG